MRRHLIPLALLIGALGVGPTHAREEVVAGLSQHQVEITADFRGSDILIYGAVRREEPVPAGKPLDVIITLEGPSAEAQVRRKSRVFGLWINTEQVVVDAAPSFYAVATTGPFSRIISDTEDLRQAISIPRAIRSVGAPQNVQDPGSFPQALIRLRQGADVYRLAEGSVSLKDDTLFRTDITLPANLVEGPYKVRFYLLRDRAVISDYSQTIFVRKVGLERWLFRLSQDHAALYGLLSLALAAALGWLASTLFRLAGR